MLQEFVRVAALGDVPEGHMRSFPVSEREEVLLALVQGDKPAPDQEDNGASHRPAR